MSAHHYIPKKSVAAESDDSGKMVGNWEVNFRVARHSLTTYPTRRKRSSAVYFVDQLQEGIRPYG
jgi:hypothetical protein